MQGKLAITAAAMQTTARGQLPFCICSYLCARSLGSIPQWMDCKIAGLMLCFPPHVPPHTNYLKVIIVLLENLCRYAMLQHKKKGGRS